MPGQGQALPLQKNRPPMSASHVSRNRRSIRLPEFDYRAAGAYFVTVCTQNRDMVLDHPVIIGIILDAWAALPGWFPTVALDEFVVMPNHIHLIIWLGSTDQAASGCERSILPAAPARVSDTTGFSVVTHNPHISSGDICWSSWTRPAQCS